MGLRGWGCMSVRGVMVSAGQTNDNWPVDLLAVVAATGTCVGSHRLACSVGTCYGGDVQASERGAYGEAEEELVGATSVSRGLCFKLCEAVVQGGCTLISSATS